jgi:hypothetical protein
VLRQLLLVWRVFNRCEGSSHPLSRTDPLLEIAFLVGAQGVFLTCILYSRSV